tara:strand:- start:249 stop:392 length:144 start_codon:yes stop_codon:yes gene_type:complete
MSKVLLKAAGKATVKLAGDLANMALKTIVVVYVAVETLEYIGILVKY